MNTEQAVQSSSSNTNVVNITDSIGIGGSIIIIGIKLIITTVITVILCVGKKKKFLPAWTTLVPSRSLQIMSDTTITLAVNVLTAERATSTHKNVKIINPVIVLTTIDSIMQIVISISIVCVGCIIIYLMPLLRVMTIIIININVMLNM